MRYRPLCLVTLLALGLSSGPVAAAPCVGFTDVEDTSPFCPGVEWLKNRAITTGCTATAYCPDSSVTRLAMAAFMNRLGKALTPVSLHHEARVLNVTIGPGESHFCETPELAAAAYPRTARFAGAVWGVASVDQSWLQGWWRYSTDGGTTWNFVGVWQTTQFSGADWGKLTNFAVLAPPLDLEPGVAYRFGLFLNGNGGVFDFPQIVCQADVTVTNRNPASSPFDAD